MDYLDYKILSIYILFGLLILIGYILMTIKYTKQDSSEIWSNQGKNMITSQSKLKYIYITMIILSFLSAIYLIYYLSTTPKEYTDEILIYVGSVIFMVCSTVWAFKPFYYSNIILGFVALGAILILSGILSNSQDIKEPKKIVAILTTIILIIQTFIFDFIIWNGFIKF